LLSPDLSSHARALVLHKHTTHTTHTRILNENVFVVIHDVVLFVVRAHEILRDAILEIRLVEEFQSKAQQQFFFFFFGESVLRSGDDECDDGGVGALPGGRGD
jgi:hypothetical protein